MLHKLSVALHDRMNRNGVEAPSAAVIAYALNIVGNTLSIVLLSLLIGIVTGEPVRAVLALIAFPIIRFLTGGYHLKSGAWCIAVSTAAMSVIPHLHYGAALTNGFTAAALVMVLIFAPANYDKYARISEKYYPLLKAAAAILVATNFFFVSDLLATVFIVQAAMLPFKERR